MRPGINSQLDGSLVPSSYFSRCFFQRSNQINNNMQTCAFVLCRLIVSHYFFFRSSDAVRVPNVRVPANEARISYAYRSALCINCVRDRRNNYGNLIR